MDNQFRVQAVDSRLNLSGRFQQTPRYVVHLNKEVANKLGFIDGDLIEVRGKKATAAKVIATDKESLEGDAIGLSNLLRNNARVSTEDFVTVHKAESRSADIIVFAPIGKRLKKSELLKIVAKKSFLNEPFVEGDVTYLRSKIMRYLLGSVTWLRVIKTDPQGIVIATDDTNIEIVSDPITVGDPIIDENFDDIPDLEPDVNDDDITETDLLNTDDWDKIRALVELGLFRNISEALSFFIKEGIKAKSDLFDKSLSVLHQINSLKKHVTMS